MKVTKVRFFRGSRRIGTLNIAAMRLDSQDADLVKVFESSKDREFMHWIPARGHRGPECVDAAVTGKISGGDGGILAEWWMTELQPLGITIRIARQYSAAVVAMARLLHIRRTQAAKFHREARRLRREGRPGSVSAIAYELWMEAHRDDETYGVFVERSGPMFEVKLKSWNDVIFSTPSAKRAAKKMAECLNPIKIASIAA
jgi:hypothetical protein